MHENYLEISPINNGLYLHSLDAKKLWLCPNNPSTLMGQILVDSTDQATGKISGMRYLFDKKWLDQDMLFITWDYTKHAFRIITS